MHQYLLERDMLARRSVGERDRAEISLFFDLLIHPQVAAVFFAIVSSFAFHSFCFFFFSYTFHVLLFFKSLHLVCSDSSGLRYSLISSSHLFLGLRKGMFVLMVPSIAGFHSVILVDPSFFR